MDLWIHHVQITVQRDQEAQALDFYSRVLGLEEIPKPLLLRKNGGRWYNVSGTELHVSPESSCDNASSKRHLCFVVPDLNEIRERLQVHGVPILEDDQPMDAWERFYVRDPGGNRLEFAQLRVTPRC
jgi:catechol 2,3-dioxygenase-like lactoylglutathione lyase family enzyme